MKEKVLIVEDERDIVKMLEYNLGKEGFRTISAKNGKDAIELALKERPNLILLDLMLPIIDGIGVCKELKSSIKTASIPIIMLTAKSQESDKIVGLELGADDYVTKPFSPRELIARIKAVLRRIKDKDSSADILSVGDLSIDISRIRAAVKGRPIELTSKEFELLKTLMKAGGRVLSRDQLLNTVWGLDQSLEIQTRTVDVHIRTLRRKLKGASRYIATVKNYGYRMEDEEL